MFHIVFIILALCTSDFVYAADKPLARAIRDFSAGVNTYTAPLTLPDNQVSQSYNFIPDAAPGSYSVRPGSVLWGTWPTSSLILDAFAFEKSASNRFVIGADGTSLRYTRDGASWTTMISGLPTNSRFNFSIVNGNLWAVSNRSYPIAFDGATVYTLTGASGTSNPPKNAKVITFWQSRVWLANTPANPSVVYFNSLVDDNGNPLDVLKDQAFYPENQLYINREDGTSINALVPYRGFLYAFKDTSIWRINFISEQNISFDKIVDNIGTVSGNTVKEWNGLLTFLSADGNVYSFNGERCQLIGLAILPQTRNSVPYLAVNGQSGEGVAIYSSAVDYAKGTLTGQFGSEDNTIVSNGSNAIDKEYFADVTYSDQADYIRMPVRYKFAYNDNVGTLGQVEYVQSRQGHLVITSSSSVSSDAGFYTTAVSTHNTYGAYTWGGSFMSIGRDGKSEFHFYASTKSISAIAGTYSPNYIGFGMRAQGYEQRMCLVIKQDESPTIDYETCKLISDLSPICLSNAISYPDMNTYKWTYAGNFLAEISVDRKVSVTATNSNYSKCNFTLTADIPDTFFLSTTSYHQAYVKGYRLAPGNPAHLVFGQFRTPGAPAVGSWTSDAIYAANNFQWGETNYTQSISTSVLTFNGEIIQGTTIYYRTSNTSSFSDAFVAIGPGVAISSGAANYIQIKIEGITPMVKIDTPFFTSDKRPRISDIFVNWQWSTNLTPSPDYAIPAALVNDNKYYLAISTTGVFTANNTIARISMIPTVNWSLYGLAASALFTFQSYPYAAIGNKIYRIEASTVTTDNGTAIDYNFETKDYIEDAPYYPKYIQYVLADFQRSASTATVSISTDGGTTWLDKSIYLNDGTGVRSTKRINITAGPATSYRLRFKRSAGAAVRLFGLDVFGYISEIFSEGK